jgi:hypothetical protein
MGMRPKFTTLETTHFNTQTQINYFPRQKTNSWVRIAFLDQQSYIFKSAGGAVGVCDVIFLRDVSGSVMHNNNHKCL